MMAKRVLLTAGTKQAEAKWETLAACIRRLEFAAETYSGILEALVGAVRSFKALFAMVESRESTAEDRTPERVEKMSRLQALVAVLT